MLFALSGEMKLISTFVLLLFGLVVLTRACSHGHGHSHEHHHGHGHQHGHGHHHGHGHSHEDGKMFHGASKWSAEANLPPTEEELHHDHGHAHDHGHDHGHHHHGHHHDHGHAHDDGNAHNSRPKWNSHAESRTSVELWMQVNVSQVPTLTLKNHNILYVMIHFTHHAIQ